MNAPQHHKGYYSIIQYCPDLSRLESANVGAVLFCPELNFLKAHVTESNDRIRRFFHSIQHDWDRINAIKLAISERFQKDVKSFTDIKDLEHFIATRANNMQLTAPRTMLVEDPDRDLQTLFDQLVGGRKITAHHQHHSSVAQTLTGRLSAIDFDERCITILYPPTNRELKCIYEEPVEDMLLENPKIPI